MRRGEAPRRGLALIAWYCVGEKLVVVHRYFVDVPRRTKPMSLCFGRYTTTPNKVMACDFTLFPWRVPSAPFPVQLLAEREPNDCHAPPPCNGSRGGRSPPCPIHSSSRVQPKAACNWPCYLHLPERGAYSRCGIDRPYNTNTFSLKMAYDTLPDGAHTAKSPK